MNTFSIELLCNECEAILPHNDPWGGLCHDCDNQMEYDEQIICPQCDKLTDPQDFREIGVCYECDKE